MSSKTVGQPYHKCLTKLHTALRVVLIVSVSVSGFIPLTMVTALALLPQGQDDRAVGDLKPF